MAPAASPPQAAAAAALSFAPAVNYGIGYYPSAVVVRDFNEDGRPDVAVSNAAGGNVSVLLGNGNGTFQGSSYFNTQVGPFCLAAGDFNGDGHVDLAVANQSVQTISVLLGNGNGTFQPAFHYGVGVDPTSINVGDFNGDGRTDLVVANYSSSSLSLLRGNGNGTFQSAVNVGVSAGPYSVAVGDFNGDGRADIVSANFDANNVSVLLGNGNGTFQSAVGYSAGNGPTFVLLGDFNSDGRTDLAVANYYGNNVSVLFGNGNGTFQSPAFYGVGNGPFGLAMGDLNGDGVMDLAATNYYRDYVSVLLGNGNGTFQGAVNVGVQSSPFGIVATDLNGDGRTDLAVANNESNTLSILLSTGSGVPPSTNTLTISKTGTGSGTVTSSPAGINCGATCSAPFTTGQVVGLTATPASGSTFAGFSGDAGCSSGSVSMSAPRSCVAQFNVTTGSVPTLKATFVGTPGQDYVGPVTPLSGNGNPDWNIHLQGLRATPVKVRITSAAGGAWEDPFNGANWIILTQTDRAGNGDLWFEPWGTPGFHVKVWYADSTTDEVDAVTGVVQPTPPPSSSFQASFLGVTGEDFAGTSSVIGANGVPDWHIRLQGLRSSVVRVQITSSSGGVWESPYNGWSWLVYIREDGSGNADLFFEPWNTAAFHVKVWYSDGSTAEVDAGTGVVSPTPPPSSSFQASFLGVTGEDFAGTSSVIGANGVPDWHIRLQGLRSSVVRVQITSSSGGVWESPYNGWSWLVYVREGGSGNADLFFEPWNTAVLHVKVWYSDGSTNEVDAH